MTRIIALAADHGGFPLKVELAPWLQSQGYEISDLGAHSLDPDDDYPDFAEAIAREVVSGRAERGIVICGSGVSASVASKLGNGARLFERMGRLVRQSRRERGDSSFNLLIDSFGNYLFEHFVQSPVFSGETRFFRRTLS